MYSQGIQNPDPKLREHIPKLHASVIAGLGRDGTCLRRICLTLMPDRRTSEVDNVDAVTVAEDVAFCRIVMLHAGAMNRPKVLGLSPL